MMADFPNKTAQLFFLSCAVALGSMAGGLTRWGAGELFLFWFGAGFPWGTLWINTTGSLLIGLYAGLWEGKSPTRAHQIRTHLLLTGFCGGYTSFSIFSLETLRLLEANPAHYAVLYLLLSIIAWLGAVWTGYHLGRKIKISTFFPSPS